MEEFIPGIPDEAAIFKKETGTREIAGTYSAVLENDRWINGIYML